MAAPFLWSLCVGICLEVQDFLICWDHELPEVRALLLCAAGTGRKRGRRGVLLTQMNVSKESTSWAVGSEPQFPLPGQQNGTGGCSWNTRHIPATGKPSGIAVVFSLGSSRLVRTYSQLTRRPRSGLCVLSHHTQMLLPWVPITAPPSPRVTTQVRCSPGNLLAETRGKSPPSLENVSPHTSCSLLQAPEGCAWRVAVVHLGRGWCQP